MEAVSTIYTTNFTEQVLQENAQLKTENESLRNQIESLKNEQLKLQLQFQRFALMVFGKKGERFVPNAAQLTLDLPAETVAPACKIGEAKKVSYISANKPKIRELLELGAYMKDLPHVYETKEPDQIPEGAVKIGEDHHETLEHTPGKTFVKVVIIPKYKIPSPANTNKTLIIAAPPPERPLFKCLAGASLLALILVDKYCDHLPLYRQAKRFERGGFALPYNTLIDLNAKAIDLITPLYMVLRKEILASNYIQADETTIKVLFGKENQKSKGIHGGYFWSYYNCIDKLVFFDYQQGRGEKCTAGILKDFIGFLQTDGYEVYKSIASKFKRIIQICCWGHARRKFIEALPYEKELAEHALKKIGLLYEIERDCKAKGFNYDQIAKVRQDKAVPILNELHDWMTKTYIANLPSSAIRSAIGYSLERWKELSYYVNDGRLNIDNNPIERSIRPIALGRKNFLFAGSHKGAERLAIIYSLVGTCMMHNVDPYEWLTDVIGKINNYKLSALHELLPHNWKNLHPETINPEPVAPIPEPAKASI